VNNYVKKEIKDSGYLFDLVSKLEDAKLAVDQDIRDLQVTRAGKNFILHSPNDSDRSGGEEEKPAAATPKEAKIPTFTIRAPSARRSKAVEEKEKSAAAVFMAAAEQRQQSAYLPTPPPLVLKVPAGVKPKKESKKERRERIANEIFVNMGRIKEAVMHFKVLLFSWFVARNIVSRKLSFPGEMSLLSANLLRVRGHRLPVVSLDDHPQFARRGSEDSAGGPPALRQPHQEAPQGCARQG